MVFNYNAIHFSTKERAHDVLNKLQHAAKNYGCVTVSDLYDISGFTRTRFDEQYGWLESVVMDAYITYEVDDEEYVIQLPKPVRLECENPLIPTGVTGMPHDSFKALLEELDGSSINTLAEKNARYSQNGDALHNFRSGAEIAGGTPAQACWGYLTKHLVALRDMVEKDNFSNREDFLEKCQDTINYIRFLWCIGNDTNYKKGE